MGTKKVGWCLEVFQKLMKSSGRGKVLELAELTSKLPAQAKELILGVTKPEEAWRLLEEGYGDSCTHNGNTEAASGPRSR